MTHSFPTEAREIIRAAFASPEWFDLYELHEQFSLSPAQMARTIEFLVTKELAEVDGLRIRLTDVGRQWAVANRADIFLSANDRPWAEVEQSMLVQEQSPTTPYLPRLRSIDQKRFLKSKL